MKQTTNNAPWGSRSVDLLLSGLMAFCLIYATGRIFVIPISAGFILLRLPLFAVLFALFQRKHTRWALMGGVLLFALLSQTQFALTKTCFWLPAFEDYMRWLSEFFINAEPHDLYVPLTYGILALLIYLPIYICMRVHLYTPLFLTGAGVFIAQGVLDPSLTLWPLFAFVLLMALTIARQFYSQHSSRQSMKALLGAIPLCLLAMLLTLVVPKPTQPLSIPAVYDLASFLGLDEFNSSALFNSGFSGATLGDGRLGGPFKTNNATMLKVTNGYSAYLRGYVYNRYDGTKWELDDAGLGFYRPIVDAMLELPGYTRQMTITYENLETDLLLQPVMMTSFTMQDPVSVNRSTRDILYLDKRQGKGFSYTTTAFTPNISEIDYIGVLRGVQSPGLLFGSSYNLMSGISGYHRPNEALLLPSTLPTRVRVLAETITANHLMRYDKAQALVDWLHANCVYETDMPAVPKDVDFVDYFLFTEQKGYCTYFASAFVVMCRSVGIPARYASGFVLKREGTGGNYYATGNEAHAWGEVYIDNVGWVIFEPTSPYANYNASVIAPVQTATPTPTITPTITPSPSPTPTVTRSPLPSTTPAATPKPTTPNNAKLPLWFWIALPLVCLPLTLLCVNAVRRYRREARIAAGGQDGIKLMWKTILAAMPHFKLGKQPEETLHEYAIRLTGELSPLELLPYASQLDALVFGSIEPKRLSYVSFYRDWRRSLKKLSRWQYMVRRYLLGLI